MTNYETIGDWRIPINGNEHGIPRVHVLFKDGCRVAMAIETRAVLSGNVTPVKRLTPAFANIEANERKYLDEYRRLNP